MIGMLRKSGADKSQNSSFSSMSASYVRLEVYVPLTHCEAVKAAMAEAGAGKLGNYDSCFWQVVGTGQFRPMEGSNPYLGSKGEIEKVEEAKIECICEEAKIKDIVAAMKKAHPYETAAFSYWKVNIE